MMTKKRSLVTSAIALVLCVAMLLGTTYAWFTDSVTSGSNIIKSGNLDIGMYWSENNVDWKNAEDDSAGPIFFNKNWEPGYTEVRYIKVTNEGSLAFNYQMFLEPNGEVGKLAEVIEVKYDIVTDNPFFVAPTAQDKHGSLTDVGTLDTLISSNGAIATGVLLPATESSTENYCGEIVVCISLHMKETAGNEYQNSSIGTTFDVKLYATQWNYESDSFGSDYDEGLVWPDLTPEESTASVPVQLGSDGTLTADTQMSNSEGTINVNLPAGTKFENGTSNATLNVNRMPTSGANITLADNEQTKSYDVHVAGVAPDNTVPIEIKIKELLPKGLNLGNFSLYHVENGATVTMTMIADGETPAHNTFKYDPATGDVTLYMASFSEVALVASEATWNGNYDFSWYEGHEGDTEFYIANADQLAAFGALVGYMTEKVGNTYRRVDSAIKNYYGDEFTGDTVYLISNIDLGDYEDANPSVLFHPIGYHYTEDNYGDGTKGDYYSTISSFEGTFDGQGHKISNFYQNTWDTKGDYDGNYYKDGMGLFGYLVNATVKNLTVDHFSSDGEFTPTGVIAAYACNSTFENIAITNCNPRVYNTGNGGIVGIGGNTSDPDSYKLQFTNITIDNTNKITSLWGSWDTACGGLVGMFRGAGHAHMINCHVGAQIDVYNDVCGNYQYYWYRYSGMLIGTNKNMYTDSNGYTLPETEKFHATNCTVHFGDWNNYYYCELVANTIASYTHDHQFSRLTQVGAVDVENKTVTDLKGNTTNIPTSGRVNYVVVNGEHATENATCYHFVDGVVWNHEDAGYEDVDVDGNGEKEHVLKEDRQHYYLPFNQLFTGYGWGVKHIPIYDNAMQNVFKGVTILDRPQASSEIKFTAKKNISPISGREYKLSHLFELTGLDTVVIPGALTVTVTNLDENTGGKGNVTAELGRDYDNWENSTLTFSGRGRVRITIQDYYYCTPTVVEVEIRNYPEGSKIRNFTYDGFADDLENGYGFNFNENADHITNGKHGTFEYDFGFGPEVLEYAYKMNTAGTIEFRAEKDGTIMIALASKTVGAGMDLIVTRMSDGKETSRQTDFVKVQKAKELYVTTVDVTEGYTYTFRRNSVDECGIYYIGYIPDLNVDPNDPNHSHAYYTYTTATCTSAGKTYYSCLVCGHNYSVDVPAFGHSMVEYEAYEATCTTQGKTYGKKCAICGDTTNGQEQESTPMKEHQYDNQGFCTLCHAVNPNGNFANRNQTLASANFKTGNAGDYTQNYGTDAFFEGYGRIDTPKSNNNYLQMKTDTDTGDYSYIEFTVTGPTTLVVVASSTNRGNTSKFMLVDENGNVVNEKYGATYVEGVHETTLVYEITAGGTYRFVCNETNRVGRVLSIAVWKSK